MYGWGRDDGGESLGSASPAMQWGIEETKELIRIRAEAESGSASPARKSKALWEAVSAELLLHGFARTPDQCKCKWKNLLNRYKGKETSDQSNGREFPFFDELHALFTERARKMHQTLQAADTASPSQPGKKAATKTKRPNFGRSDESSSEYLLSSEEEAAKKSKINNDNGENGNKRRKKGNKSVGELVEELVRREAESDKRWAEMVERRERERAAFEEEWRARTLRLERERLAAEQAWREREEARREREEGRADRRDALLTSLLNSLIHDH